MGLGAHTPEALDALLEDAFVLRDRDAVRGLFEPEAVLLVGTSGRPIRGVGQIADYLTTMWHLERTYLASSRQVIQARDTALVVGDRSTSVVRRGDDRAWRFVISNVLLDTPDDDPTRKDRR